MLKRLIATTAAVATLTGGVVVPAQAAQNSGYNNCYIAYNKGEQTVLDEVARRSFPDLNSIHLGDGWLNTHDAAVVGRFFNVTGGQASRADSNLARIMYNIRDANKLCAGAEYDKLPALQVETGFALGYLGMLSADSMSSKDDKGSSNDEKSSLTKADGSLTPGGIALVVTAVLAGLAILGIVAPKPQ